MESRYGWLRSNHGRIPAEVFSPGFPTGLRTIRPRIKATSLENIGVQNLAPGAISSPLAGSEAAYEVHLPHFLKPVGSAL